MTEEKREAAEACPDCGLQRSNGDTGTINTRCFTAREGDWLGQRLCRDRTVTRLRSELSTLRQQLEAERHGVWKEAFGEGYHTGTNPTYIPPGNPYPAPPPAEAPARAEPSAAQAVEFLRSRIASHRKSVGQLAAIELGVDELLREYGRKPDDR